jgi:GxxExxY protein
VSTGGDERQSKDRTLLACARIVFECGQAVWQGLGAGFSEQVLQAALAIEFRERQIPYLREPHIEVYYRGQCVGLDRPDFALWADGSAPETDPAVILEVKQADRILDEHRQQLLSYLKALPTNRTPRFAGITTGLLLRFPKVDRFDAWEGMVAGEIELEMWSRDPKSGVMAREAAMPEV